MKILALSNLYPPHFVGGYELHCQTICQALRDKGHNVHVLTSTHGVSASARKEVETGVRRELLIHGMFGHPWLPLPRLFNLERHNNQTLLKALAEIEPDLVYVWNMSGLSKSMLFTLERSGVPTSFRICDHWIARSESADVWLNWWHRADSSWRQRSLRSIFRWSGLQSRWHSQVPTYPIRGFRFRRIHFCSKALRDLTAAAGFDVEHGAVIHCSVNTERFIGAPKPASQPLRKLLYVGRLTPDKGVMTAAKAMALLKGKFNGSLTIVGGGDKDYVEQLKGFVQKENLPVHFTNASSPDEMPKIYQEHDALLFTSEWPEPFAITPLEAMACGLPVIGTTTGGSAELFREGINALTYRAADAEELSEKITQLELDNELRESIATTGQQEVRTRLAEPIIAAQIESYLQETLRSWSRPGARRFHGEAVYN